MITITEKARNMLRQHGAGNDNFLRIRVKSGGCAGMTYDAEIDDRKADDEKVVQCEHGIRIISNQESLQFLEGLSIDYSDDLISAGFRFNNSSNDSSCGCGASFALAGFPTLQTGGECHGS
ncbi:HesB/IscA family protein [Desulfogranum mediterraneum]|uniref:HesB/IscA family protein n=1 Tax=Desulfogranum mediterraneum TaxID=160661 RepID=UPI0006877533|nr:iron-sulfur cluster assembly accessory protein [Desulfogranum mediterraneum]